MILNLKCLEKGGTSKFEIERGRVTKDKKNEMVDCSDDVSDPKELEELREDKTEPNARKELEFQRTAL